MLNFIISYFKITFFFTVARDSNHMRWYWNGAVCGGLPHRIFTVPRPEHAHKPVNWKKTWKIGKKRSDFDENQWESVHTWSGPVKTCCRLLKSTPRRPQIQDFLLFFGVFRTIFHHFFDHFSICFDVFFDIPYVPYIPYIPYIPDMHPCLGSRAGVI